MPWIWNGDLYLLSRTLSTQVLHQTDYYMVWQFEVLSTKSNDKSRILTSVLYFNNSA